MQMNHNPSDAESIPDGRSPEFASWTKHEAVDPSQSFAHRMLLKMGFTGRLGRHEDGIANPVSLPSNQGSSGLGFSEKPKVSAAKRKAEAEVEKKSEQKFSRTMPTPSRIIVPSIASAQTDEVIGEIPHSDSFAHTANSLIIHISALLSTSLIQQAWINSLSKHIQSVDTCILTAATSHADLLGLCDEDALALILHSVSTQSNSHTDSIHDLLHDSQTTIDCFEKEYFKLCKGRLKLSSAWSSLFREHSKNNGRIALIHSGSRARCAFDIEQLGCAVHVHSSNSGFAINAVVYNRLRPLLNFVIDSSCLIRSYRPYTCLFDEALSRLRVNPDECIVISSSRGVLQDSHVADSRFPQLLLSSESNFSVGTYGPTFQLSSIDELQQKFKFQPDEIKLELADCLNESVFPHSGDRVYCMYTEDRRHYAGTIVQICESDSPAIGQSDINVCVEYDAPYGNRETVPLNFCFRSVV